MNTAFVFPGQGSQYVGMGKDFLDASSELDALMKELDQQTEFPLRKYIVEGPAEKLERTKFTQPAVFAVNQLVYRYCTDRGLDAEYFAGHSLGEYNAYVASGRADLEQLWPVVVERGEAMDQAAQQVDGGMAAVLKLDRSSLEELCETISSDDS
ncbi:MAG: ACP S-malonyltransferase, partial [bacterium]